MRACLGGPVHAATLAVAAATILSLLSLGLVSLACGPTSGEPAARLERGRQEYAQYCRACHGEDGRGEGPASLAMRPPPRDFTSAQFKFGWVVEGLPSDDDFARIVIQGLHGTAMRGQRLHPESLDAILQYIKTFDAEEWTRTPPGRPILPPPDPWSAARKVEAIARGSMVYHGVAQCHSCHPAYVSREEILAVRDGVGAGADLHESRVLLSDYRHRGERVPLVAPDFTWHALRSVRDGSRREDLVRVIAAGIPGTAMPTWEGALSTEDLWALAWYVEAISSLRDRPEGRELRERLRSADGDAWSAAPGAAASVAPPGS